MHGQPHIKFPVNRSKLFKRCCIIFYQVRMSDVKLAKHHFFLADVMYLGSLSVLFSFFRHSSANKRIQTLLYWRSVYFPVSPAQVGIENTCGEMYTIFPPLQSVVKVVKHTLKLAPNLFLFFFLFCFFVSVFSILHPPVYKWRVQYYLITSILNVCNFVKNI